MDKNADTPAPSPPDNWTRTLSERLQWIITVATALTAIVGAFVTDQTARRMAIATAVIVCLLSAGVSYVRRRRLTRPLPLEFPAPTDSRATLRLLLPFEDGD